MEKKRKFEITQPDLKNVVVAGKTFQFSLNRLKNLGLENTYLYTLLSTTVFLVLKDNNDRIIIEMPIETFEIIHQALEYGIIARDNKLDFNFFQACKYFGIEEYLDILRFESKNFRQSSILDINMQKYINEHSNGFSMIASLLKKIVFTEFRDYIENCHNIYMSLLTKSKDIIIIKIIQNVLIDYGNSIKNEESEFTKPHPITLFVDSKKYKYEWKLRLFIDIEENRFYALTSRSKHDPAFILLFECNCDMYVFNKDMLSLGFEKKEEIINIEFLYEKKNYF